MSFLTPVWWGLLLTFLLGQVVYMLKRADYSIKSSQNTAIQNMTQWLKVNGVSILFRIVVAQVFFWIWVKDPSILTSFAGMFGLTWNLTIPLNYATAIALGLASDSLLDWAGSRVPVLKTWLA